MESVVDKDEYRRALTIEEQQTFHNRILLPEFEPYRKLLLLQYYFGLRPWFTESAREANKELGDEMVRQSLAYLKEAIK